MYESENDATAPGLRKAALTPPQAQNSYGKTRRPSNVPAMEGHAESPTSTREHVFFQALGSVGGVAALFVGLLYLTGIVLTTVVLRSEGLAVRDALPLFPLEQVLRTGLTLVAPALVLLSILGGLLALCVVYESKLIRLAASFREEWFPQLPDAEREERLSEFEKAERKTNWPPVVKEVEAALEDAKAKDQEDRIESLQSTRRWFSGFDQLAALVGFLWLIYLLLLPPVMAGVAVFLFVVSVVVFNRYPLPVQWELISWYAIIIVCLIASALIYPRNLPKAEVITNGGNEISGRLTLVADSTWYLSEGHGAIRAVPSARINCSRIEHSEPEQRRLFDLMAGPPAPERMPALNCGHHD